MAQRYAAIAMDQQSVVAARRNAEPDLPQEPATHSMPKPPQVDVERFVALRLPAAYLGAQSQAFAGTLRFEIRAISNAIAPSKFDRGSGLVVLRARLSGERS